ncbi:MAG: rubredoxin [Magnetococcus sp. YQC-9]
MTTSLETLVARAVDLGLQSSLATPRAAALLANKIRSPEAEALIQESQRLTADYKSSLKAIEAAAPQQYTALRNQVVDLVRKAMKKQPGMRKWRCQVCNFLFDERIGLPRLKIPASTSFQDLPDEWECPDCDSSKEQFVLDRD